MDMLRVNANLTAIEGLAASYRTKPWWPQDILHALSLMENMIEDVRKEVEPSLGGSR